MQDYTGLGAVAWELFSGEDPGVDYPFFRRAIEEGGEPALDVGCATGRLLLPLLQAGFDVDGVEPSEDMLTICRRRAVERGLTPALHRQTLQGLTLPRRYRTIIVPCGTIQLIAERAEAAEALRRCHVHLTPGGHLVLILYNRWRELERERVGEWVLRGRETLPDGTELAKDARVDASHLLEQRLVETVRYRVLRDGRVVEEQVSTAPERWYFVHEMTLLLERAGFHLVRVTGSYTDNPATDDHGVLAFVARA